ncbi:apolipoprotein O, a isoform X2 [Scleropages formosus]|uniref:apolipoprotein O, a isoform X2 n=1 Tax=Scleropages formosus TaxID=113540 RepID=UPI0010FAB2A8|nr:MICOS complex subunit MIC26 isoform X2 [Scleropages formosus]
MYKVAGLATAPGAVGLMAGIVYAASEEKHDPILRTDELSLYTTPQEKSRCMEPEPSQLEQGMTLLRKAAEPYTTWCQGVYGTVKPKVENSIQFGKDSYEYLKDPPSGFYARAGVIGFAGILGLFLSRGSRIKKLIYPTGLMALSASLYYPQQAATIAKSTGDTLYEWSLQGYVAVETLWKAKANPKQVKEQSRNTDIKIEDSSTGSKGIEG